MNAEELVNAVFELGLNEDKRIMALLCCVVRNPNDAENVHRLHRLMAPRLIYNKLLGKPFKNATNLVGGLIRFAMTELGLPVGVDFHEPHALIVGRTRCGKTIMLLLMLGQALMRGASVWLFTKAKDSRKLLRFSKDIIVIDFREQVSFNPLLPPGGVDAAWWVNCFADLFVQAFGLYDGTKNFLIESLNKLLERKKSATIVDLYDEIRATKYTTISRFARYQESALNRLGGIISGLGRTLTYPCVAIEDLVNRNVIFEVQGLTSEQQVFFVNILVSWLFHHKLNRDSTSYNFVGIDDANLVFDKNFEFRPDRGLPIISHLLSTVAKSRTNVLVCSQIPHQLGASIHSNAFAKIMFSLSNGKDIECMTQSMGIRDREQLQYCHKLGEREIVVKFSGRHQEPFLAYIPEIHFPEAEMSDEEVMGNNERLLSTMTLIASPDGLRETSGAQDPIVAEQDSVSPEEKAFLWDIYNRPCVPIWQRYRTVDVGG